MSVKEQIKARVDQLDENEEWQLMAVLSRIEARRRAAEKPSLFDRLLEHQFDGPPDLSTNLDRYASGELKWEKEKDDENE